MPTSLQHRVLLPELMDDPQLDRNEHRKALKGLARINRISDSVGLLMPGIKRAAAIQRDQNPDRRLRILDLACGSGDVLLGIKKRIMAVGLNVEVVGVDISKTAVDQARHNAEAASIKADFQQLNVTEDDLPRDFDVIVNSLFLHHLSSNQVIDLLERSAAACRVMVLANDLRRSRLHYLVALAATRLLSRSRVVHTDGPRSVRSAWTAQELLWLAEQAGLKHAEVDQRFPFRMVLCWEKR